MSSNTTVDLKNIEQKILLFTNTRYKIKKQII